ncbi:S-adenosyl-L-methionine-dependent methyltransferase [Ilyonectria robusta]|uniref:S-adenosyl-L-methionine-dependent methyltransferase n=1 Tax=Ilyonectria robusta TaxID=1079257 RepID=UPI001E8CF6EA|nr:S-adenosyl-L-methionine-dependent methyltransferase [Ilyonectria robusta]KAH8736012.1 S-adenosyl-L-methionine-dependent methyltransferase [Ilyonectria robusta]
MEQGVPLDETFAEILEYHGRSYQQYSLTNATYFVPIDEDEIARLELMHGVLNSVFDNRLIFPPVRNPRRILDCGCGSGDWAVDVAAQNPNAEVLGIDVSPHMIPENPPDNLELQVDDLNARFTFRSNHFDLVHSQMMAGGIHANRWRSYIRDIFRVLRPGGWCQMVEIYFNAQSDNGTLTRGEHIGRLGFKYLQSAQPYKDPRAPLQLANWMRSAGFTEIESRLLTLPMCAWSNDPRDYNIGWANNENVNLMLYSLALYPFTQLLGMTLTDFQLLIAQARSEAGNPAFKAYFPIYVCIGRKPRR